MLTPKTVFKICYFQAVNFGANSVNMKVLVTGLDPNVMRVTGSKKTVLTSTNVMDENSFSQPEKVKIKKWTITNLSFTMFLVIKSKFNYLLQVVPHESLLEMTEEDLTVVLPPHSFSSFDLLKESAKIRMPISDSSSHQKTTTV